MDLRTILLFANLLVSLCVLAQKKTSCDFAYFEAKNNPNVEVDRTVPFKTLKQKLNGTGISFPIFTKIYVQNTAQKYSFFEVTLIAEKKDSVFQILLTGKNGCFTKSYYRKAIEVKTVHKGKPIVINQFRSNIDSLKGIFVIQYRVKPVDVFEWEKKNGMFIDPEEIGKRDTIIVLKPY